MRREGGRLLWSTQKGGRLLRDKRAAGFFPWSDKGDSLFCQATAAGSFALCRKGGRLLYGKDGKSLWVDDAGPRRQAPRPAEGATDMHTVESNSTLSDKGGGVLSVVSQGRQPPSGTNGSRLLCVVSEGRQAPELNGQDAKSLSVDDVGPRRQAPRPAEGATDMHTVEWNTASSDKGRRLLYVVSQGRQSPL